MAQDTNDTICNLNQTLDRVNDLISSGNDIVAIYADMELSIHKMDLQFNALFANLEADLKKYDMRAAIVKEQLNGISNRMDKMLDNALMLDTDSERMLDFKMKLLETINNHSADIATMVMKLL